METLKGWAVCVVVSCAVAAAVEVLAPEGGSERPVKFITSAFVLLAFVSPLADLELPSFEGSQGVDEFIQTHELEKQIEAQARESLETQTQSMLRACVEGLGAVCERVETDVVITSDKEIYIDSITVYVSGTNETAKQKLAEFSRENFGVTPEVKETQ